MWRNSIAFFIILGLVLTSCGNEDEIMGDRLFEQGKYHDAISAYTKYLELQPTHVKSIYNRGRAFEELGQYGEASSCNS